MVAKIALQPVNMEIATLIIAQLIAIWVNGVTGARAPRHVAMAIPTAVALLLPTRAMEVMNAVILLRVLNATMAIAQLTAMRVNGVTGVRAPRPVAVATPTALAIRPHRNMEVRNVGIVLMVFRATTAIAQLSAMRVNGVIGVRALSPVETALNPALAL